MLRGSCARRSRAFRRTTWLVALAAVSMAACAAPKQSVPAPRRSLPGAWTEQSGRGGSPTFQDIANASGPGPVIAPMTYVEVSCKVLPAKTIDTALPGGYWYRIASAPWNNAYYAAANTFWNGDIPGRGPYTHHVDPGVPDC